MIWRGGEGEREGRTVVLVGTIYPLYLMILVTTTLPQLRRVTVSPSDKVWASAPSMYTFSEYHTSFSPASGFWDHMIIT